MRAVLAIGLTLCLAVVPVIPTRAAKPLPANADPDAQVRSLHDLGMAKFASADYEAALILWKQAFVQVTHGIEQQSLRAVMVANILEAHSRAYEIGRNPEHLVEAMRVIDLRKAELAHYTRVRSLPETWGWSRLRRTLLIALRD